jgi:hypothetical protein
MAKYLCFFHRSFLSLYVDHRGDIPAHNGLKLHMCGASVRSLFGKVVHVCHAGVGRVHVNRRIVLHDRQMVWHDVRGRRYPLRIYLIEGFNW